MAAAEIAVVTRATPLTCAERGLMLVGRATSHLTRQGALPLLRPAHFDESPLDAHSEGTSASGARRPVSHARAHANRQRVWPPLGV